MNVLIILGILVLFLVLVAVFSIERNTEYQFSFEVQGSVVDAATNTGIDGARVVFIDTSLDYRRSKTSVKFELEVGFSAQDGSIGLQFDYWWGRLEKWWRSSSPFGSSIRFRIEKQGFQPQTKDLDPRTLNRSGDVIKVDLGTIGLSR